MRKLLFALLCCLPPFAVSAGSAEEPPAKDPLDQLDAAQVARALDLLKTRHIRGGTLDEAGLSRATLRGLLEEWNNGAALGAGPAAAPAESAFRSETLEGGVGYVRLGSLKTEHVAQLDAALRGFAAAKAPGVVLDLRATPASQDLDLAAQVASRFVPSGTKLWTLVPAGAPAGKDFGAAGGQIFAGTVAVVTDGQTSGAPEALAAALRRHARALLVGTRTSGRAAEFAVLPLGGDAQLRLAVAEVRVDGLPPLCPHGLAPDIAVGQEPDERDRLLAAALTKGAAPFIFERGRARMNEAALVAGTNPEIAAAGEEEETELRDRPLQRAVDLVTAIGLFRARAAD